MEGVAHMEESSEEECVSAGSGPVSEQQCPPGDVLPGAAVFFASEPKLPNPFVNYKGYKEAPFRMPD